MRPFLLSLTIMTLTVLQSFADAITVTGSVSGVWEADTVRVTDDIILNEGDSLFIYPGVLVEFQGSFSFYVGGYIRALGTGSNLIRFDVADTTGFSVDSIPDGGWNGIQFYYTHHAVDSSIFEHCFFRHGKAVSPDTLENHGGVFCIRYFDKVRISHCTFQKNFASLNGGAVYLDEADIVLSNNGFTLNSCGPTVSPWGYGGAICSDNSDPLISGNLFESNASTGVGGAVAIRFRDARVHNNVFAANYSALGGAVGYLHYYEYPHSQCNNLVFNNASDFFGGGIACLDAGPTFVNTTLTGNYSAYGGAFYVKDSIVPNVYNSILWGNGAAVGPEVYLWDAYASANFYYSDVAGGPDQFGGSGGGAGYVGEYKNNLDIDPLFEDPSYEDYHLSLNSPLQNMGTPDTTGLGLPATDLDGVPRIDIHAQVIDMGCYELQWVGVKPFPGIEDKGFTVFPNPAKEYLHVWSSVIVRQYELLDLSGRVVRTSHPDAPRAVVDLKNLTPGSYLLRLYSDTGQRIMKILID